jgi:hypothetical protein
MRKSPKEDIKGKALTKTVFTGEQLLIVFVLTVLASVFATSIVFLSIQKDKATVINNPSSYPNYLGIETLYVSIDPEIAKKKLGKYDYKRPLLEGNNLRLHQNTYRTETIDLVLEINERLEYKAMMDADEVLLYDWKSDGNVHFDFHANETGDDTGFWTMYSEGEGRKEQGSIVALYTG